jgi:aminoglycoside phosphotransferase (APT) family kinase protein
MEAALLRNQIERAVASLSPGATVVSTRALCGGISAKMVEVEFRTPLGEVGRLVARKPVRRDDPHSAPREFATLVAIHAAGVPCPRPRYLEPSDSEASRPLMLLDHIDGTTHFRPKDLSAFLHRYAAALAGLHRVGTAGLNLEHEGLSLDEPRPTLNAAMREPEVLAALAALPVPAQGKAVVCHGDFWPGNVLWRDEHVVGIIDWEEAHLGHPLTDVSIARLDLWFLFGRDACRGFTAHYAALTGADLSELAWFDLRAALRPMANLAQWATSYPLLGRPDVTFETMSRDHGEFVGQALAAAGGAQ